MEVSFSQDDFSNGEKVEVVFAKCCRYCKHFNHMTLNATVHGFCYQVDIAKEVTGFNVCCKFEEFK